MVLEQPTIRHFPAHSTEHYPVNGVFRPLLARNSILNTEPLALPYPPLTTGQNAGRKILSSVSTTSRITK